MQNLDPATLEVYIQQLQDQFSKGSQYDVPFDDDQVCLHTCTHHVKLEIACLVRTER